MATDRKKPSPSQKTDPDMKDKNSRMRKLVEENWDSDFTDSYLSTVETLTKVASTIQPTRLAKSSFELLTNLTRIATGNVEDRVRTDRDPRFADPTWQENPFFKTLSQSYAAWSDAVMQLVDEEQETETDWRDKEHTRLLLQMLVTSLSPSNFLLSNPKALDRARETRGKSLARGMQHLLADLAEGRKLPRHVDPGHFEVGVNLATTPGAVIFRNEVLELIQYRPTTDEVLTQPTLIVPPQINKYYLMDMAPGRSFVEYAVSRGVPVFAVSWRNPGRAQSHWDFDDYIQALYEAIDAVCDIGKSEDLNLVGICAGGITTTVLLNTMAARGDSRIKSVAYAVTLLDFDVPCPLGALHSESIQKMTDKHTRSRGVLPGNELGDVFCWLRANDLVWRYWTNNYLMGDAPKPFDILYWNQDSTNLPQALHQQFMRVFGDNVLCKPGELTIMDTPVDLSTIEVDTFVTGAEADHLTPWRGCYRTTQLLRGESTFVLTNAGHIAGLINPPTNPKARFLIGPAGESDPDTWKANAETRQGTWWQAWAEWIMERAGDWRPRPRRMGNRRYPILCPAPGTYVKEKPVL
jgi:polyhydroxyalkanoate synthase